MRKQSLILLALMVLFKLETYAQTVREVVKSTTNANNRLAPQASQRFLRSVYIVSAFEMNGNGISAGRILKAIGFNYNSITATNVASGNLKVYLKNTQDEAYSKGALWDDAIADMVKVSDDVINITATLTNDFEFKNGTAFEYTGENLYVALEYINATGALGTANSVRVGSAKVGPNSGVPTSYDAYSTSTATPTDPNTLISYTYRPHTRFTYQDTDYKDVVIGSGISDLGSAPQTSYKSNRGAYIVTAAELAEGGINGSGTLKSLGFNYQVQPTASTSGNLVIYLQNTTDVAYGKGTSWSDITDGMTKVKEGAVTVPASKIADFQFQGSGFSYTGGSLYIAFEYINSGTVGDKNVSFCNSAAVDGSNGLVRTSSATSTTPNNTLSSSAYRPYTRLQFTPSALPVNLVSFVSKVEANKIKLQWTTASEKDNDYFKVLRSTDGVLFHTLTTQKGKGTYNLISNYTAYDNHPNNGINYYKLMQYDFDGKATEIDVKTANFTITTAKVVSVFPNPIKNIINLKTNNYPDSKLTLTLSDLLGRTFLSREIKVSSTSNVYTFDLPNNVIPGQYILKITGNKSFVQAEKIIIK